MITLKFFNSENVDCIELLSNADKDRICISTWTNQIYGLELGSHVKLENVPGEISYLRVVEMHIGTNGVADVFCVFTTRHAALRWLRLQNKKLKDRNDRDDRFSKVDLTLELSYERA